MKNNSFWFRHDANSHTDGRILELKSQYGVAGFGMFWEILEAMYNNEGYITKKVAKMLCKSNAMADAFVDACIELELFHEEQEKIFSKRLLEELINKEEKSKKARESAMRKWRKHAKKKSYANASANGAANVMLGEERRGEENIPTEYGKSEINTIIQKILSCSGATILDGSVKDNRYAAKRLLQKITKVAGSEERAMQNILAAIECANADPFHAKNITSVMYLENNILKIMKATQKQSSAKIPSI